MPNQESVEGLVALVEQSRFVDALEKYYADDAVTYENLGEPRRGLELLIKLEHGVMAAFKEIRSRCVRPIFVNGDHVAIRWQFEFVSESGKVRAMDEIAHQLWRGDKIIEERFFYNPAQMQG